MKKKEFVLKVDGLNTKIDELCQMASRVLENSRRPSTSTGSSISSSIFPSRSRPGTHRHRHRRSRRLISSPSRTRSSPMNPTTPPPSLVPDRSHESLLTLYGLFQENLNSSKTDLV